MQGLLASVTPDGGRRKKKKSVLGPCSLSAWLSLSPHFRHPPDSPPSPSRRHCTTSRLQFTYVLARRFGGFLKPFCFVLFSPPSSPHRPRTEPHFGSDGRDAWSQTQILANARHPPPHEEGVFGFFFWFCFVFFFFFFFSPVFFNGLEALCTLWIIASLFFLGACVCETLRCY